MAAVSTGRNSLLARQRDDSRFPKRPPLSATAVPQPCHFAATAMAASRLLLPMQAAMKLPCQAQGWRAATKIAPSLIDGAGNGRFASEDILAGTNVSVKPLQAMATLETLHSVAPDQTLSFSCTGEFCGNFRLGMLSDGAHASHGSARPQRTWRGTLPSESRQVSP